MGLRKTFQTNSRTCPSVALHSSTSRPLSRTSRWSAAHLPARHLSHLVAAFPVVFHSSSSSSRVNHRCKMVLHQSASLRVWRPDHPSLRTTACPTVISKACSLTSPACHPIRWSRVNLPCSMLHRSPWADLPDRVNQCRPWASNPTILLSRINNSRSSRPNNLLRHHFKLNRNFHRSSSSRIPVNRECHPCRHLPANTHRVVPECSNLR